MCWIPTTASKAWSSVAAAWPRSCGRDAAGRALTERLRIEWQATLQRVAALRQDPPQRVLFVLSHTMGQARVAGQDTGAAAVIAYAGARNAFAGANGFAGYKPLTPEAVIAAAPDVILGTEQGLTAAGGIDGLLRLPGLAQTPAGQARRVIAFDALLAARLRPAPAAGGGFVG